MLLRKKQRQGKIKLEKNGSILPLQNRDSIIDYSIKRCSIISQLRTRGPIHASIINVKQNSETLLCHFLSLKKTYFRFCCKRKELKQFHSVIFLSCPFLVCVFFCFGFFFFTFWSILAGNS
jgi:hypothetical protein